MEEAIPRKAPEKDCVDTKEKGSPNLLKSKGKASGSQGERSEGVCGRSRRKLKEVGERSAKT